jgi:hypothetical protein
MVSKLLKSTLQALRVALVCRRAECRYHSVQSNVFVCVEREVRTSVSRDDWKNSEMQTSRVYITCCLRDCRIVLRGTVKRRSVDQNTGIHKALVPASSFLANVEMFFSLLRSSFPSAARIEVAQRLRIASIPSFLRT